MTSVRTVLAFGNPVQHVLPHELFRIGAFGFTSDMLMQLIVSVGIAVVFIWFGRNYPLCPTGLRMFFETGLQVVREGIARPALKEHTDRYAPFVWTLFFFILFNNLAGLPPWNQVAGLTTRQWNLFSPATSNLSVTAGLAAMVFVVTHVAGMLEEIRHQRHRGRGGAVAAAGGFLLYWYHLVPHVPGLLGVVLFPFLFVMEVFGSLIKPFALAMRLFANIMAGHILLGSLMMLAPVTHGVLTGGLAGTIVLGCVAVSCLELFAAFLQAYIFAFLSCLYIGMALNPEH
ncbi:MAG TPA: F0F1 ATP synthase subunit A [Phycisphaerae bacterium]|nr:F0F1 ATP synthase subunit A [Phycisphaerae bacterium]